MARHPSVRPGAGSMRSSQAAMRTPRAHPQPCERRGRGAARIGRPAADAAKRTAQQRPHLPPDGGRSHDEHDTVEDALSRPEEARERAHEAAWDHLGVPGVLGVVAQSNVEPEEEGEDRACQVYGGGQMEPCPC